MMPTPTEWYARSQDILTREKERTARNPNLRGDEYLRTSFLGKPEWTRMTARERQFAEIVVRELGKGLIPGPTFLNEAMGLKRGGNRNVLSGNLSTIRRCLFEGAGLKLVRDRYRWPS